jgi:hypothetical protein
MISAEDERKLLKVADQVSELLVAAWNRGGGQGNLMKMIYHVSRLVDVNWGWGRAEMISLSFSFLQRMEIGWEKFYFCRGTAP